MRQAFLKSPRLIALEDRPIPAPRPGEVLLRVRAALTCGTDLKTYRRGHPRLPAGPFGHECAGDVIAVGAGVQDVAPGDAVMLVPTASCGECAACRAGADNHCPALFKDIVLGAYADYLLVSAPVSGRHLFRKPANLSYIEAAFLEPLACVLHGWRRLGLPADSDQDRIHHVMGNGMHRPLTVLVVGLGPIGLLQILVGRELGYRMVAAGRRQPRLSLAQRLGAAVVDVEQGDISQQVLEATATPADLVIECTGNGYVWERSPDWVRPGGRVLLFGGLAGGTRVTFGATRLHYDEVDLIHTFHYTARDVEAAYRWLIEGRLNVKPIISAIRPLEEIVHVFEELDRGEQIKVALIPASDGERGAEAPAWR